MLWIVPGIITSYLIGSIPTAYIFVRCIKGIDIRQVGSGNVGATNAMRVLGKKLGLLVLLLDVAKGTLAVMLLTSLLKDKIFSAPYKELLPLACGLGCISGHNWTIFLKFKGGKGVATTLGVLIGFAFEIKGLAIILALALGTWVVIFLTTRIVSVGSIITAILFPLYMVLFRQTLIMVIFTLILAIFILYRHLPNLKRLLQKKEKRIF